AAPAPRPAATPAGHGQARSAIAASRAETATVEPIERSISPAVRTNTVPTAIARPGGPGDEALSALAGGRRREPAPLTREPDVESRYFSASRTALGATRCSDSCQPCATLSFVTVRAGTTMKGGAALSMRPYPAAVAMVRPIS